MKILTLRNSIRLLLLTAVLCAVGTGLSSLAAPATSLTVVNNSSREILHLYLSPADNDQWGTDQLNESAIAAGATRTLNVSWNQSTVKIIAEDRDGCFLTTTADASGSIEWTITNSTAANCGSGN